LTRQPMNRRKMWKFLYTLTLWNRFVASLSTQKILHTHPASGYINGWVNFKSVIKTIWYYFVVIRQYFFPARYSIEKFKIISLILPPLQKKLQLVSVYSKFAKKQIRVSYLMWIALTSPKPRWRFSRPFLSIGFWNKN